VSPNNPYQPDDESNGSNRVPPPNENHAGERDPLAGNPYSNQQRQAPQPDLDGAAPHLTTNDMRRMNRSALGLLGGIVLLLVVVAFWLFHSSGGNDKPANKPREETVSVPDAPTSPFSPQVTTQEPRAITLAPQLPPPTLEAPPIPVQQMPTGPHIPTLLERRIAAANGNGGGAQSPTDAAIAAGFSPVPGAGGPGGAGPGGGYPGMGGGGVGPMNPLANSAYSGKELPEVSSATPLQHPDTLMLRGTFIRCVLETRIITDIPGFTSCVVTEPVYSFTGKRLLLPKGSKVLGKYEMEPNGPRVAVIWDRIVTPTGIDVNMASPGIDTLGGAGHPGHYNAHWGSRIGAAMLISLLSDAFKYEAAEHGPRQTEISNGVVTQSPFESNTADTVQQLANQAVQRQANRPATVTINQGTVLAIYVAKDVDFTGVVARY
jgi:type IV secretion system protein VirB10